MLKVSKIEIYTRHLSLHTEVVQNTTIKHHSKFGTLGSSGLPECNCSSSYIVPWCRLRWYPGVVWVPWCRLMVPWCRFHS